MSSEDDDDSGDFTRIEDLGEFDHEDEPEVDAQLESVNLNSLESLDGLEDVEDLEEAEYNEGSETLEEFGPPSRNEFEDAEEKFSSEEDDHFATQNTNPDLNLDNLEHSDNDLEDNENSEEEEDLYSLDEGPPSFEETEEPFQEDPLSAEPIEEKQVTEVNDKKTLLPSAIEADPDELSSDAKRSPVPNLPEDFKDIRNFADSISYGLISQGGNPPFSVLVSYISYEEDVEDISIILKEFGLMNAENEDLLISSMKNGQLLISQISEFSAILLAQKLRRFHVSLELGLSEEIRPSTHYEQDARGLVTKDNIFHNLSEEKVLEKKSLKKEDIIIASTPSLEGHFIHHYIDFLTLHKVLHEEDLAGLSEIGRPLDEGKEYLEYEIDSEKTLEDEREQRRDIEGIYELLIDELRNLAFKRNANALVALNFQLIPLNRGLNPHEEVHYKLTCTGNAVWAVKNKT